MVGVLVFLCPREQRAKVKERESSQEWLSCVYRSISIRISILCFYVCGSGRRRMDGEKHRKSKVHSQTQSERERVERVFVF